MNTNTQPKRRLSVMFLLCLLLLLLGVTMAQAASSATPHVAAPAQQGVALEPVGHFGGWLAAVAVPPTGGDYVYLGEGSGFTVLDVSDTDQPAIAGSLPLSGFDVNAIAVSGATAYAVNDTGLQVVDITEPISPSLVGHWDAPSIAQGVFVTGATAYVTARRSGGGRLYILDVSNPAAISILGSYDTPETARGIYVAGNTVYVADGNSGLLILDVSDPASPSLLGSYGTTGHAQAVQVAGSNAYLLADGWLHILDVSDPANPTMLGSYDLPGAACDIQVVNTTAYVADGASGLEILDVGNPATPVLLGISDAGWWAAKVAISGSYAYVGGGEGVRILDVSDPANPNVLGDYKRPTAVMDVIVDHPYGYIAGWNKLWVVDMTNPALPVPLGVRSLQDVGGEGKQLSLSPHPQTGALLAYVAEHSFGMEIFNVADPNNPVLLGQFLTPGTFSETNDVFVAGQYAYVLTVSNWRLPPGDGWLRILDVNDPANPTEAGAYDTPGDARRVFVADGIAYVADGEAGLRLINVSTPASPVEIDHIDPPAGASTNVIFVDGDRAYVGSNTGSGWRLQAFDVSDPTDPALLAEQQGAGRVNDIDVGEKYVYLAVEGSSTQTHSGAAKLTEADQPGQDSTDGMHVYRKSDLSSEGLYRTKSAASVHRYSISIADIKFIYEIIDKASEGMEIVKEPPQQQCSVFGVIDPAKAKADGCTMSPEGAQPCQCGVEEISFTETAANGWEFLNFNPKPPIKCPQHGQKRVVAQFAPTLMISGRGDENLCVGDKKKVRKVLRFSLLASKADSWRVSTFTFKASGDGDDARNVKHVKLFHEGVQVGGIKNYNKDNGTVQFTFPRIEIPAGGPAVNFILEYTLDYEGMEKCGTDFRNFLVSLKQNDLLPQNYPPGVTSGGAVGGASIGCVMHEDAEGNFVDIFDTIQDAVDAAGTGTKIAVCPGRYQENIVVEQPMTIRGIGERRLDTNVRPLNANQHVFNVTMGTQQGALSLATNVLVIQNLYIHGATGPDQAGIYLHGSSANTAKIHNCLISENTHGIYMENTQRAEITGNNVSDNSANGITLKSSTESTIKGNSISDNGLDGIYMENCQETAGKETKITNSNGFRENKKNGIHLKQSKGVTIEDNTSISSNGQHGIFLENSEEVKIINNPLIKQNEMDGIKLDKCKGVEIKDNPNIDENTEKGISLYNCIPGEGEKPITIKKNTISGNRNEKKQKIGIYVENSKGVQIGGLNEGNQIRNHMEHGISLVNSTTNSVVRGNTLNYNDKSGIHLKSSCLNTITQNTISLENLAGIRIESSQCPKNEANSITLNTIEKNDWDGIYLNDSYGNEIGKPGEANTIRFNKRDGIGLEDCDAPEGQPNAIRANIVKENEGDGIFLRLSKRNVIADENQIAENHGDGIHMLGSALNEVKNNKIYGEYRQKNGIHLDDCNSASIEDNEIKEHREDGISVENSGRHGDESIDIIGNTINKSDKNGIELSYSCRTWIGLANKGNTIESSDWEAIKLTECRCSDEAKNHIAANTIKNTDNIHNEAHGIHVEDSYGAKIGPDNDIKSNDGDGVYLEKSAAIEVFKNSVQDNKNGIHLSHCQAAKGSENKILFNTVEENSAYGIYLDHSYGTKIGEPGGPVNTVRLNNLDGVRLDYCSSAGEALSNSIVNNVIKDKNNHGIYLLQSRNNLIKANEVRANDKDGIHLKRSNGNQVYENADVAENGWHGVYLKESVGNEIAGNQIINNKMAGVLLYHSKGNFVPKRDGKPNKIEGNHEDGIRIDGGQQNTIYTNVLRQNRRDGIRLSNTKWNEVLGKQRIEKNGGDGISLERSIYNVFQGPFPHKLLTRWVDYDAVIVDNGGYGIHFRSNSHANKLIRYAIGGHRVCMRIKSSSGIIFDQDLFFACTLGVRETDSRGNRYTLQMFKACTFPAMELQSHSFAGGTGLHLENSSPVLDGCAFLDNQGDGIRSEGGSQPIIEKSNIHDNGGAGLNNLDATVTVSAQNNWWGDASGPGGAGPGTGDEIHGAVDFAHWRPTSVTLVAIAEQNPFLVARGTTDANRVVIRNWQVLTDTVTVNVIDSTGWLAGPETFTVTLEGPMATVPISFTLPTGAALGATDKVTVTVVSQANPSATDTESFQVVAALLADLQIAEESGPEVALQGFPIRYTLAVSNAGPDTATGVTISNTLPISFTFVSAAAGQGTCAEQDGVVVCDVGALDSDAQAAVTITVRADATGDVMNVVEVAANERDPHLVNNKTRFYTSVEAVAGRLYLPLLTKDD